MVRTFQFPLKESFLRCCSPDLLSNINRIFFWFLCDGEMEMSCESANGHRVCLLFLFEMHGVWYISILLSLPLTRWLLLFFVCRYIDRRPRVVVSLGLYGFECLFFFFFIELLCPISSRSLEFWFVICGVFSYNCVFCVHAMIRTVSVKLCSYRAESLIVHTLSERSTLVYSWMVYVIPLLLHVSLYRDVWNVTIYMLRVAQWPRTSSFDCNMLSTIVLRNSILKDVCVVFPILLCEWVCGVMPYENYFNSITGQFIPWYRIKCLHPQQSISRIMNGTEFVKRRGLCRVSDICSQIPANLYIEDS